MLDLENDIILQLNGNEIDSVQTFNQLFRNTPMGNKIIFKVKHKAKYTALQSTARGVNYGVQTVAGFAVAIIITGTAFKLLNFTRWKIIDIMTVDDNNNKTLLVL